MIQMTKLTCPHCLKDVMMGVLGSVPEVGESRSETISPSPQPQPALHPGSSPDGVSSDSAGGVLTGRRGKAVKKKKTVDRKAAQERDFSEFWKLYPRTLRRSATQSLYIWWLDKGYTSYALLAAAGHVRNAANLGKPYRFILHSTTFLSKTGQAWKDWVEGIPDGELDNASRPPEPPTDDFTEV